jgi:hypothetical protein
MISRRKYINRLSTLVFSAAGILKSLYGITQRRQDSSMPLPVETLQSNSGILRMKQLYEAVSCAISGPPVSVTVACWLRIDPNCLNAAYVFDKLLGSSRSSYRLEIKDRSLWLASSAFSNEGCR